MLKILSKISYNFILNIHMYVKGLKKVRISGYIIGDTMILPFKMCQRIRWLN